MKSPFNKARLASFVLLSLGLIPYAYSGNFFDDDDYQRQQSQADRGFDELDQTDGEGVWHKPKPKPAPTPQEKVIVIIREAPQPAPAPTPVQAPVPTAAPAPTVAPEPQPPARKTKLTKTGSGVAFEFDNCIKAGNEMECSFNVTSQYFDRTIAFGNNYGHIALLYDNVGNEYRFYKVKIGSKEVLNPGNFKAPLVADTTTPATFYFSNISTQATSITKLELNSSANKSGQWENFILKFRQLPFAEQ